MSPTCYPSPSGSTVPGPELPPGLTAPDPAIEFTEHPGVNYPSPVFPVAPMSVARVRFPRPSARLSSVVASEVSVLTGASVTVTVTLLSPVGVPLLIGICFFALVHSRLFHGS